MRIVVIGATGHIGTWLVPRLVRGGHKVIAVSRGERRPYHESPEWSETERIAVDRSRAEADGSFGQSIAALDADAVIDLICFDVASAAHLVTALRGSSCHLIHCGTLWVHGVPRVRPYDETVAREPFGDYGIRKAEIEAFLLDQASKGLSVTVLHPGHITGPGWNPINPAGNLEPAVFSSLARGDVVPLPDDGMATLQHVHADDVAQAFELAISNRRAAEGEAFHVASALPVTMKAFAMSVAAWHGREANLEFLPWEEWKKTVSPRNAEITLDHVQHSPFASIAKAVERLAFGPRFTAVEAVRDALGG